MQRTALISAAAVVAVVCLGCTSRAQLPPDQERALMATQLGISPQRIVFSSELRNLKPRPLRAWRVHFDSAPYAATAELTTYSSVLFAYIGPQNAPRSWIRPPGVALPQTKNLTRDEAIAGARQLAEHFWPDCAPYVNTATVLEAKPDQGSYLVRLALPAISPLVPQEILVRLAPNSGACEAVQGHQFPGS